MSTEAVAAVEERNHIALIERFVAGVTEVCGNTGKIEVDAVMFGGGINAIQISNSLIFDKSRYRTPGYRKNFLIDRFPLRINLSIPDHIKPLPQSLPLFRSDGNNVTTEGVRKTCRVTPPSTCNSS